MAGTRTVALRGRMVGPEVTDNGGLPEDDIYMYKFTPPGSGSAIDVNWREIWDIDKYPHKPGDTPEGRRPKDLGQRTIRLESDSDLAAQFLTGQITEVNETTDMSSLEAWEGQEQRYGPGPAGTTFPPCLCNW